MSTTKKHIIEKVACEKTGCNESFNVIISPIYTVVTSPVTGFDLSTYSGNTKKIVQSGEINNYIVAKCHCGHTQRVYLKTK